MKQETSDLTVKKEGALATLDFESDSGMGLENIDKGDLALPFLKLLQSGSYETKKKHAKYVEGAEAGMFYNTVTKKLYSGEKGIHVIPCFYKMTYPEWAPFDKSEGRPISPDRGPEVMAQTTKNGTKDVLSNGNEIIKTANHFVVILGDKPEKALMSLKTTQLKTSRGWNSLMDNEMIISKTSGKSIPAPSFSRVYKINSVENTGNFTWHGMVVNIVKPIDNAEIYSMAKDFNLALHKSNVAAASVEPTSTTASNY
jgi:hypothetical protein|tara:strand:+ start:101 stop:868 length:768 start_codon:yes stop_codon:yes gene_type:complete